jgi:hypothetical protein
MPAIGAQMIADFPGQLQGLRESFQKVKQERNTNSAAASLPDLRAKVHSTSQMVRTFFQKRQGAK